MILDRITLKRKIALGYTLLLITLLSIILTISYNMVGYQFRKDIEKSLLLKERLIVRSLGGEEHSRSESNEEHSERSESRSRESLNEENRSRESSNEESRSRESSNDESRSRESSNSIERDIRSIRESISRIVGDDLVLYYSNNRLQYSNWKEPLTSINSPTSLSSQTSEGVTNILIGDTELSVIKIDLKRGVLYIGSELTELKALQKRLLNIFAISSIIGIILSILFGMIATQQSMNIIKRITKTTNSITSNNLNMRIDTPKGDDEITQLVTTLNSMIDRLEKAFMQSKQFTQDAAHEIRTPLTIIRGELDEILSNNSLTDPIMERLSSMLNEVHYLSSISERLLLINTLDSGTIRYDFKQLDLTMLMRDIYQDAKIISGEKQIEVSMECDSDIYIDCNQELITRLLWNLIDNAIKYNRESGTITISAQERESEVVIKVQDSGIGIPQSDLNKIFERFYRVDKSHSRKINGSGLGLSICKWIVDLHKGTINVSSSPEGATFTIQLPKTE